MFDDNTIYKLLESLAVDEWDDGYDIGQRLQSLGYRNTVRVRSGASKICLVFKDFPYVIKWSTGEYGEAMAEVRIYQDAVQKHLEKFFPETLFFANINGIDFVLQEKIDTSVNDLPYNICKEYEQITKTVRGKTVLKMEQSIRKAGSGYHRALSVIWAKMAIQLNGKKACKALCLFIIAHAINDLHESNLGFKNGRPIILDFSGYNR